MPRHRANTLRVAGRSPSRGQASSVAQIGIVKVTSAASDTLSQRRDRAVNPIQANTLVPAARARRRSKARGGRRASPRKAAALTRPVAAITPAVPRANKGGQSCMTSFIIGQPRPQPAAVTITSSRPTLADRF